jgi:hypothetical protein
VAIVAPASRVRVLIAAPYPDDFNPLDYCNQLIAVNAETVPSLSLARKLENQSFIDRRRDTDGLFVKIPDEFKEFCCQPDPEKL